LVVLLGLLALLSTAIPTAAAEPPIAVDQLLTDRGGVLGTETAEAQQALEALREETAGALHVVLVSSFDGATGADWVEQVATQSDIGSSYLLLAITTEGHTYEWWLGDTAPWDATRVDEVITAAGEPEVVAGNWAGAITAVAEGLRTGEIPAADTSNEAETSEWTSATTTAVVGFVILFVLAGHQLSRRAAARRE
jgi:uncharacterized membrane protein YgcG